MGEGVGCTGCKSSPWLLAPTYHLTVWRRRLELGTHCKGKLRLTSLMVSDGTGTQRRPTGQRRSSPSQFRASAEPSAKDCVSLLLPPPKTLLCVFFLRTILVSHKNGEESRDLSNTSYPPPPPANGLLHYQHPPTRVVHVLQLKLH